MTREGREKETREEKRREQEKQRRRKTLRVQIQNASVCAFRKPPCVPGKRPHVQHMLSFSRYTRRRLARTHGGVLNLHKEGFSAWQAAPHHTTHHQQNTQHHNTTYTPQHTSHAHNHVNTHTTHTHTHTRTHTHTHTHTHTTPHIHTMHKRHPTVILRRKNECLDMCTDAPPRMFLHSIKIWITCNVCNFMRTLCFWN